MKAFFYFLLDFVVPLGALLRSNEGAPDRRRWTELFWRFVPQSFFGFWLLGFIPFFGGFLYMLVLVPLSAARSPLLEVFANSRSRASTLLVFWTVILIGFGGIWSGVGHLFLAEQIANGIGWPPGSPFQTELAFYHLGFGVAGLMAIWIRGHFITGLIIVKSIFLYGAAGVHIFDAVMHQNYAPLNIGTPLVGDIVYPTMLLLLCHHVIREARN